MKFSQVALLLVFVGVTNATWCWENGNGRCPGEQNHGDATSACCDQVGSQNHDRGCWVTGQQHTDFFNCCVGSPWFCDTIMD
ncbi:hypothetical protein JOM56_007120 [Amanita muscaria]